MRGKIVANTNHWMHCLRTIDTISFKYNLWPRVQLGLFCCLWGSFHEQVIWFIDSHPTWLWQPCHVSKRGFFFALYFLWRFFCSWPEDNDIYSLHHGLRKFMNACHMKLLNSKVRIKKGKWENGYNVRNGEITFNRTQCQTFIQGLTTFYGKEPYDLTMVSLVCPAALESWKLCALYFWDSQHPLSTYPL